ncbi:MAG: TraB/GumN family protein [Hellea sp.]|nr:TraB/GumN family protein [Hellea sp.]
MTLRSLFVTGCIAALFALGACKKSSTHDVSADFEAALAAAEASKGSGDPALWKLSDEDTDIYIFGTVHLLPTELQWETSAISTAFKEANKFYMEADINSPEAAQSMMALISELGTLPEGKSLYDMMGKEDSRTLKAALEKIDLNPDMIKTFQPWYAGLTVQQFVMLKAGYNPLSGVEMVLIKRAEDQGKEFGYFETLEDQMRILAAGDAQEQLEGLVFTAETIDLGTKYLDILVDEWSDGDVTGLSAIISAPEMFGSEEAYDRFLTQRNRDWIPQIEAILDEPGQIFIAVGAAHLAGPDSVILMLENEGYTVTRVQ